MKRVTSGLLAQFVVLAALCGCSDSTDTAPADAAGDVVINDTAVAPDVASDAPSDVQSADVTPPRDVISADSSVDVVAVDARPDSAADASDGASDSGADVQPVDVAADAASDVPVTGDAACTRPDIMRLTGRIDCGARSDGAVCPTGYECLSMSGVVLQQSCGRSCRSDCDCPTGETCGSYTDKAGTHSLCVGPAIDS